jgi:hypothetical protein
MKSTLCTLALLATVTLSVAADSAPALSIERATQLAKEALAGKGGPDVFIQSIALEHTSILGGQQVWIVKWSSSVPAVRKGGREWGLQIGMDGKVVHLVKDRATSTPTPPGIR